MNSVSDIARNYDQYFASHLYDRRYPGPNPSSLAVIIHEIAQGRKKLLDLGCGNGRYTIPLLAQTGANIIACDMSHQAINTLSLRCAKYIEMGRLQPVCSDSSILANWLDEDERFDLVIMMFGVLGHISSRTLRQNTLTTIRKLLRPGGRLIVTVPNVARRFRKRQIMAQPLVRAGRLEPGDIFYQRTMGDVVVNLYYHLYALDELVLDLKQGGFRPLYLGPESVLPESGVVRSISVRWIDRILAALLPLRYAYGFLAMAEVEPAVTDHDHYQDRPRE
ncbi:MAG: class I SAM-dependent methyltransferase [Phycisphaerales bacterium]|nr:class I SAM-dependent methyltransferase [Phycisphaerales bacterium]